MFARLVLAPWFGPALIAVAATIFVTLQLDSAGDYPGSAAGPGLTVDEIFNVQIGVEIADPLLAGNFPKAIKATRALPDHPPLGRLWLGVAHEIGLLIHPPGGEHSRLVVACARVGSAVAFGCLIFLTGLMSTLWQGRIAGYGTAIAIVLMPRVFGHAHLAALESVLNLTYAGAILSVAYFWADTSASQGAAATSSQIPMPSLRSSLICGALFGLALLTKIQAIFLPIPIAIWAICRWRWRAIGPLTIWGITGLFIFWLGWPWIWLDPLGNTLKFLGQTNKRPILYVWYLGQQFADRSVPWHYPWVLFATTIPLGLHLAGLLGLRHSSATDHELTAGQTERTMRLGWMQWIHQRDALLLLAVAFPLMMFSIPGVAVYDGERLFLVIYPLWGLFIGKGLGQIHHWLSQRVSKIVSVAMLLGFLSCQAVGLVQFAPCWLSYYNGLVGGLWGAERLGFQTTYWGDGVTRDLLMETANQVPIGAVIDVLPVQHSFQLPALESQCPALRAKQIVLRPFDERAPEPARYLLAFHRRDYWPADWQSTPPGYRLLSGNMRQGVIIAGLYERVFEQQ